MSGMDLAGFGACGTGGCARFAFTGAGALARTASPDVLDIDAGCAIDGAICATGAGPEFAAGTAGAAAVAEDVAGRFTAGGADSVRGLDLAPGNKWK
jgi:hypothetical protein